MMINFRDTEEKIQAAGRIYGDQSLAYFEGALHSAYEEVDAIERALGVDRLPIRSRLDQFAALIAKVRTGEEQ